LYNGRHAPAGVGAQRRAQSASGSYISSEAADGGAREVDIGLQG